MVRLLESCFADRLKAEDWSMRLKKIIPSWGESLIDNADLCERVRADTASVLHLRTVTANP